MTRAFRVFLRAPSWRAIVLWLLFLAAPLASHAASPTPTPAPSATPQPKILPRAEPGFAEGPAAERFEHFCAEIYIAELKSFAFTDMERRLICGDREDDAVGKSWEKIPANQAAYFLRGFWQARGYHQPEFVQDGTRLFARAGSQSTLSKVTLLGGPRTWDPPKRRLVEGLPLTPTLLDDLQGWALTQIEDEGYACALAESRADPATGEAQVTLAPGELKYFDRIEDTGDTGLRVGVLDRYNAFVRGDLYRQRLVTLTKRRIQDDGFLQTLVLRPGCETPGEKLTLNRDIVLGPSRTISIGVGGSTDEGARFRFSLRRNRIGDSASSARGRVNLSYLNQLVSHQVADANFRWFYAPGEARSYVEPSITFEHVAEVAFENQSLESKVLHGWNTEFTTGQLELRLGPTLLSTRQFRGVGAPNTTLVYAEGNLRWTSHDFEYFATSPREGESIESTILMTQQRWGANFTAQSVRLSGEKLWQIGRFDPPLFVLGARFALSTVLSADQALTADLPVRFLTFIGGDRDLRGFERASLPRSGVGALSGATGSVEGRLHKILWRRADLFGFVDGGVLGQARFRLEKPLFLSPGMGVRWESPIGVLRGYVAQRFAVDPPPDQPSYDQALRLGITYGEEF